MLIRLRQHAALIALALAVIGGAAIWWVVLRGPTSPADLASYLPNKDGTMLYVDVDAIRKSGVLNMLAGSKTGEEPEYRNFVQQTGFDYRHDLDAVVATLRGGQFFFVLRGRFAWNKLSEYARQHGGGCKSSYCAVQGSTPQRRISFYKLRSNLMALAISPDDMAAYQITRNASHVNPFAPDAPIWVLVPSTVLKEAESMPAGIRSFALAMDTADRAVFSVGPNGDHLEVSVNVTCASVEAASNLLVQLENTTNLLRRLLAREHRTPNEADLASVLASGSFRREDRKVLGQWPLQRAFVDSLSGGSY